MQSACSGEYVALIFRRVWELQGGLGLSVIIKQTYCGDYMFSGHTVWLTVCYLMASDLLPRCLRTWRLKLANSFFLFLSLVGVYGLIASRVHYTIDTLVSYCLTHWIFWLIVTSERQPS